MKRLKFSRIALVVTVLILATLVTGFNAFAQFGAVEECESAIIGITQEPTITNYVIEIRAGVTVYAQINNVELVVGSQAYVQSGFVTIYDQPSTDIPSTDGLYQDTIVTIVAETDNWWEVEYLNDRSGFIQKQIGNSTTLAPVPMLCGTDSNYFEPTPTREGPNLGTATVIATTCLNVRTGPGVGYRRVDCLPNGAVVRYYTDVATENNYQKIQYEGQDRWVYAPLLDY